MAVLKLYFYLYLYGQTVKDNIIYRANPVIYSRRQSTLFQSCRFTLSNVRFSLWRFLYV